MAEEELHDADQERDGGVLEIGDPDEGHGVPGQVVPHDDDEEQRHESHEPLDNGETGIIVGHQRGQLGQSDRLDDAEERQ